MNKLYLGIVDQELSRGTLSCVRSPEVNTSVGWSKDMGPGFR